MKRLLLLGSLLVLGGCVADSDTVQGALGACEQNDGLKALYLISRAIRCNNGAEFGLSDIKKFIPDPEPPKGAISLTEM